MTFEELARGTTPAERDALAWHLACHRMRKTWETLRTLGPDLLDGIRQTLNDREEGREP